MPKGLHPLVRLGDGNAEPVSVFRVFPARQLGDWEMFSEYWCLENDEWTGGPFCPDLSTSL